MNFFRPLFIVLAVYGALSGAMRGSALAEEGSGEKEVTIESFLQSLSTVPGTVGRRDPFAQVPPPFGSISSEQLLGVAEKSDLTRGPLERYPITDYEVVAVLLGEKYPRALVRVPPSEGGKGPQVLIVKENDKLGAARGVISKINEMGILVQQTSRGNRGAVEKWTTFLKVGGTAGMQRQESESLNRGAQHNKQIEN